MTDCKKTSKTTQELADLISGRLDGPKDLCITGIANLREAGSKDASFLGNKKYSNQVKDSDSGLIIVPEDFSQEKENKDSAWVYSKDPTNAFTAFIELFSAPSIVYPSKADATAVVAESAKIADNVHIGACAVIAESAKIGKNTIICAGSYVGHETVIGENCFIHPNVTIRERALIGNNVIIHSGSVIGSDGFGYIQTPERQKKVPQVGIVQLDDDVEIGSNTSIDRARFGRTWIKKGVKIDNLVQIAHNVIIGEHSIIIAHAGIAGSVYLEKGVIVAGQAGIAGHLKIGQGTIIMAQSGVTKDQPPKQLLWGTPAEPRKKFVSNKRIMNKIKKLQNEIEKLKKKQ
ncbi:MAG: UDP-3-O-(3-hydroxymyristoyl)glucosamine N-acyltransferase [Verrucomicrobiota bacterium]|nr:UDP-3-O-(3-hydroxymyristoyl)glucosamine N-acyltransferase [Verrucomicrobiota bacterium]